MFRFIIDAIITVGVFIVLGLKKNEDSKFVFKFRKQQFFTIIPVALFVGQMCVAVVPANTVGVKYSSFTGTSENTLGEGVHFKTPFDTIYEIDTTVQERTGEKIKVQTSDAQFLEMVVNIKYQVSSKDAIRDTRR